METTDPRQLSVKEWAHGFHLAYYLQPNQDIAECVTAEAWSLFTRRCQASLPSYVPKEFKRPIPEAYWFQYCVYIVSEAWEKDQEGPATRTPQYVPIYNDYLIRYLKHGVLSTMDRPSHYVAGILGCWLYTYRPQEISAVVTHLVGSKGSPLNIGRILERTLLGLMTTRFGAAGLQRDGRWAIRMRCPHDHEPQLINEALRRFTLWNSPHLDPPPARPPAGSSDRQHSLWGEDRAKWWAARSDWEWFHALIDPSCMGLPYLIAAYNEEVAGTDTMQPNDPDNHPLRIPLFDRAPSPDRDPPDRRTPPPFTDKVSDRIQMLYNLLEGRMRDYRLGQLRLRVDGHEYAQCRPETPVCEPFQVPVEASRLEVWGTDTQGDLLLALFLLPELAADADVCQLTVPLPNAATLVLRLRPVVAAGTEAVTALRLQVAYETLQSQTVAHKTPSQPLQDRIADQIARAARGIIEVLSPISAPWFVPLAGVPVGAADIPPQEHVFQLDEGFIQVTCQWWAASQGQPATVWLEWKTDTILPGDLWVRFTPRDDTSTILAERPLGNAFRGECSWLASDLGFDPMHEPWALLLLVKASQV